MLPPTLRPRARLVTPAISASPVVLKATSSVDAPSPRWTSIAKKSTVAALVLAVLPVIARASTGDSAEVLHIGQKVARVFQGRGLSDEMVVCLISAMPVVELRGAIPVGAWMGLPLPKVLGLCIVGNMLPIAPILYLLRFGPVQRLLKPVLDRAQSKASAFKDERSRAMLLAAFVGIPLPGTGAWTGAMGAFLLGMPFPTAMASIFAGVVSAGLIMTAVTAAGTAGAAVVGAVLIGAMISQVKGKGSSSEETE